MERKLYRSSKENILGGVCGGLSRYFGIDLVIIRLISLILLFHGAGLFFYIVAWIIIPMEPKGYYFEKKEKMINFTNNKIAIGITLIVVGLLLGLNQFWFLDRLVSQIFHLSWKYIIPICLVIAGIIIISQNKDKIIKKDPHDFR